MVDILSFKSLEWRREVENEYFISSQSIDTEMARGSGPAAGAGDTPSARHGLISA